MPVLRVEDPDTGQVIDVPWEGEGVPDAETIRAARQKALAAAPKPAVVGLVDLLRESSGEIVDYNKLYPVAGGPLWLAKKTAELASAGIAKVRRPVDWAVGQTLRAAAARSQASLADPTKRAALEARFPGEAAVQASANQRRLAAAARLIAGPRPGSEGGTLGSEFQTAVGAPTTKTQAAGDVLLRTGIDFSSDPSTPLIAGAGTGTRLGSQLQYVLGAALSGSAGLGAARKAQEVIQLGREGKLNSPTAAAAATESVLSALMAGFGARGAMKGWSRDRVLGEIERAQKESDLLAAEGVGQTPPEVAGAVGFLKPLLLRHARLRTEFNKNVKTLRGQQGEALRKAMADLEANPSDEQAAKVYESLRGEAGAPAATGEPSPVPEPAVAALRSWIGQHAQRDPWTALHAHEGLDRLLGQGDSRIPLQPSEKAALVKVFGKDAYKIGKEVDAELTPERSALGKAGDLASDLLFDSPRALQASADLSATLRQAGPPTVFNLLTHPIRTVKDVALAARAFANPQIFRGVERQMRNYTYDYTPGKGRPAQRVNVTQLADEFGLDRATKLSLQPGQALEDYFSEAAVQKVPVVGEVVKGSERGYQTYLDTVRMRMFRDWDEAFRAQGHSPETKPELWKQSAEAINELTGLAKLPNVPLGKGRHLDLQAHSPLIRMLAYAPRFFYSRVKLLGDMATGSARYSPPVRNEMLKITTSYLVAYGSLLYGLKQLVPGVEIETDPRSSDFVKIKQGNTRFDIWAGLQQPFRLAAQSLSGERKSTTGGEVRPIPGAPGDIARRTVQEARTGQPAPRATDPMASTWWDVLSTFAQTKASPIINYGADIARGGKDIFGKAADVNPLTRFAPFGYRDVGEAAKSDPLLAMFAVAPLTALGVGTQTFTPDARTTPTEQKVKELRKTQDQPPPPATPEEKLGKRVKRATRAEYEARIREALSKNDELTAMEAIVEAQQAGFKFTALRKKIMGYDTLDENENESEE